MNSRKNIQRISARIYAMPKIREAIRTTQHLPGGKVHLIQLVCAAYDTEKAADWQEIATARLAERDRLNNTPWGHS